MNLLIYSLTEKTNPLRQHNGSIKEKALKKNLCYSKAPGIWGKVILKKWNFTLNSSCKTEGCIITEMKERMMQSIKGFIRVVIYKLLRSKIVSRDYSKNKFNFL